MKSYHRKVGASQPSLALPKTGIKAGLSVMIGAAFVVLALFILSKPVHAQTELVTNGTFQSGSTGWVLFGNFFADTRFATCRSCPGYSYLSNADGSSGNNLTGSMHQTVAIPSSASSATLTFWYNITSQETLNNPYDTLNVTIQNSSGAFLSTVAVLSNINKQALGAYQRKFFDMTPFKGQTVRVHFLATTDSSLPTTFRIDDVSLTYSAPLPPKLAVGPPSLDFGSVQVGSCSTAPFAVQHVLGTGPTSGTVSASPNPPFTIVSNSSFSVSNGQGANVGVRFCPLSAGSFSGSAVVSSPGTTFTGSNTVMLNGTGFNPVPATGAIQVNTTLNGSPWSGIVNYNVNGPVSFSGTTAPADFQNRPTGNYILTYASSGPANASFFNTTPSSARSLGGGQTITFTLNFISNPVPFAPTSLIATALSSSTASLAWTDNSNNETGFKIERKFGTSGTYGQIATQSANLNFFTDSGLSASTQYCYRVRAYNAAGNFSYSNESCTTTPGAQAFSISGQVTSGGIGVAGIIVSLSGAAAKSATTDSNGNYTFTGLGNGSYSIVASKSGCTVSPSTRAITLSSANVTGQNFTVTCGTPPLSFSLTGNAYCNTTPPVAPAVKLTWTASNGATSYDIYRKGSLYALGVTGSPYDNNANVAAGQTYTYYVVARNSAGNTNSNTITVTVPTNICPVTPVLIAGISPASGLPGTTVAISGSGFGPIPGSVKFASTNAVTQSWSNTLIHTVVPSIAPGSFNVSVITSTGQTSNTKPFTVLHVDPPPQTSQVPVILVHGWCGSPGTPTWGQFAELLAEDLFGGDSSYVHFAPYDTDRINNIATLAGDLAARVKLFRTAHRVPQVDIVAHSMGGLVARAWISGMAIDPASGEDVVYNNEIRKLITVATPHFGTPHASWEGIFNVACLAPANVRTNQAREMMYGSHFIWTLDREWKVSEFARTKQMDILNIVGTNDSVSTPIATAALPEPDIAARYVNKDHIGVIGRECGGFDGIVCVVDPSFPLTGTAQDHPTYQLVRSFLVSGNTDSAECFSESPYDEFACRSQPPGNQATGMLLMRLVDANRNGISTNGLRVSLALTDVCPGINKCFRNTEESNVTITDISPGSYALTVRVPGFSPQTVGSVEIKSAQTTVLPEIVLSPVPSTSVTLVSPNGGESWRRGTTQTIRWTYTGNPGSRVKIEILRRGAVSRVINLRAPIGFVGSGSYRWPIPTTQTLGSDYRIRITSNTNNSITDDSNANFTIR